ncbi:zeta toxin family protein [Larkinella sp. C7]|jgi:predicted ABC-type ATPase|uniref:zeta toxin family protein n=1 Tax=Larkinella sp. C7 TaxID=2576607 RepID=UPI00111108F3|nr:zeta toxin family protein [Larkinella sp. C7]
MPNLYILAGCNGAGKTTAAYTILPEVLNCREFVNADEIAKGLSPFQPETVAFEAGRIMLNRINHLLEQNVDFAVETTLSTRSYVQTIKRAKQAGYSVTLFYVWIESVELAKERVGIRVAKGGHSIPPDVIERRYSRSIENLLTLYVPISDRFLVINNSGTVPEFIAQGGIAASLDLFNVKIWEKINQNGRD